MNSFSSHLFPKYTTLFLIFAVIVIIGSLYFALFFAQRDIRKVYSHYVPLVEYSASLVKLNADIAKIFEELQENKNNRQGLVREYYLLRTVLSDVIRSINDITKEKYFVSIARKTLFADESRLLEKISNGEKILKQEFENYQQSVLAFSNNSASTIETVLNSRDDFLENMVFRNSIVFGLSLLVLLLWLTFFGRLIFVLRSNIKERDRLWSELTTAKIEIESLLRVLSHDIATPLSVMLAYSDIKLEEGDSKMNQKKVNGLKRCSQTIRDILVHVREMQSIKDGKKRLSLEKIELEEIFSDLKTVFENRLEEKDMSLEIDTPEKISVHADMSGLKNQVLSNIVSNCIKFSEVGSVIRITTKSEADFVEIEITDHGIGMPAHILDNLFETDVPTSRPGLGGEKGTGFGMPIVKAYMEQFGGNINVSSKCKEESDPPYGTTFYLRFPRIE